MSHLGTYISSEFPILYGMPVLAVVFVDYPLTRGLEVFTQHRSKTGNSLAELKAVNEQNIPTFTTNILKLLS
jgi:hypothetical protein